MLDSKALTFGAAIALLSLGVFVWSSSSSKTKKEKTRRDKNEQVKKQVQLTDAQVEPNAEFPLEHLDEASREVLSHYCGSKLQDASFEEQPEEVDARDADTPDKWIKRHKDLIRLTGRHPFNCEAPLSTLFNKGFITPSSLHYVRTHGATPSIKWQAHKLYIGGNACAKPFVIDMQQLVSLPHTSLPVTLVCCGNR